MWCWRRVGRRLSTGDRAARRGGRARTVALPADVCCDIAPLLRTRFAPKNSGADRITASLPYLLHYYTASLLASLLHCFTTCFTAALLAALLHYLLHCLLDCLLHYDGCAQRTFVLHCSLYAHPVQVVVHARPVRTLMQSCMLAGQYAEMRCVALHIVAIAFTHAQVA